MILFWCMCVSRDKVCSDALDLKRVLNRLMVTRWTGDIEQRQLLQKSMGSKHHHFEDKKHNIHLDKGEQSLWVVSVFRGHQQTWLLDNFLKLDKSTGRFSPGNKGRKMLWEKNNKWINAQNEGELQIHADMIVGADGDHSVVLRSLNVKRLTGRITPAYH